MRLTASSNAAPESLPSKRYIWHGIPDLDEDGYWLFRENKPLQHTQHRHKWWPRQGSSEPTRKSMRTQSKSEIQQCTIKLKNGYQVDNRCDQASRLEHLLQLSKRRAQEKGSNDRYYCSQRGHDRKFSPSSVEQKRRAQNAGDNRQYKAPNEAIDPEFPTKICESSTLNVIPIWRQNSVMWVEI